MNILPRDKQVQAVGMLCEGNSIRATARITNTHRDTIMRLGRDVGEGYARLHDELFLELAPEYIELDEAWSFVHTKQARKRKGDPAWYGDQYSYIAMDADSKAILAYLVGKRNDETTIAFALDLRSRVTTADPQLTSDGFHPYVKAIAIAFGLDVDYAQLVKMYKADCSVEAKVRTAPAQVVEAEKEIIFGNPDWDRIATSYIERQNLTLRMHTRRFTRLTNGFSKILRNHVAAMDLYVGYFNLCWVHSTLETSPAVAVGATDHVWTVDELVGECLLRNDRENPPVRWGSQRYEEIVCQQGRCGLVED